MALLVSSIGVEERHEFSKVLVVGDIRFNKVQNSYRSVLVLAVQNEQKQMFLNSYKISYAG